MLEGVGRQCQGMDREVQAAESLFGNLAQRVGAVPKGAPVSPAIRRQRWSPVMVSLLWERCRGGTDNTHGGVVGDDGINDTSARCSSTVGRIWPANR